MGPVRMGAWVMLFLLPSAAAQQMQVDAVDAAPWELVPGEEAAVPLRVSIDCAAVLQAAATGASTAVNVTADVPADWNPVTAQVVFQPSADCLDGPLVQATNVGLRPSLSAAGLEPYRMQFTASGFGTTATLAYPESAWVAYAAGHRLSANITFPVATAVPIGFDLVVAFEANAPSMIMFENIEAGGGTLSGLGGPSAYYTPGMAPRVFPLRWDPPAGAWSSANVTFAHYIHFAPATGPLPEGGCEGPRATQTWRIEALQEDPVAKTSPGAIAWAAIVMALAARCRR